MGKKAKARKKERKKASAKAEAAAAKADITAAQADGSTAMPFDDFSSRASSDALPEQRAEGDAAFGPGDGRRAVPPTELAARLAGLSTVLQRHLARADAGDGLTRARLSALALLVMGGPKTLGQLAAAEHIRPPTMTRLVHAMEADGLVAREPNPADRRSIIIRATSGGERALTRGRARQIAPLADGISGLAGSERRQLEEAADLLGRLLRDASWESTGSLE